MTDSDSRSHKKCTQNAFPICGTCARLNLECVREPLRKIVPPQVMNREVVDPSRSMRTPTTVPPLFILSQPSLLSKPGGLDLKSESVSSHHRYAMRYYVNELASHFSVSPKFNSFLSGKYPPWTSPRSAAVFRTHFLVVSFLPSSPDFLPMAMQSQALQEALSSLASSHISLSDPTYAEASLDSRAKAIVHLKSAIDLPQRDTVWSQEHSATCLVFAMGLITTSDSQGWYSHMVGAKQFILSAQGSTIDGKLLTGTDCLKQTAEGRWVLRNFAYHDVLGCVTLRRRPLLDPDYIMDICDEVDSYMGVGTGLLQNIAEIQTLAIEIQDQSHEEQSTAFSRDFEHRWTNMEKDLQNWDCPVSNEGEALKSIAFAYRSVALILLYRVVRSQAMTCATNYPDEMAQTQEEDDFDPGTIFTMKTLVELLRSKISFQVSETVRHVSAIPVWSAPEAAILFPLFIAGGEAHDERLRELIQTRLRHNLARRKFQNISCGMEILEIVWRKGKDMVPGASPVNWEDVLEELGRELVLT